MKCMHHNLIYLHDHSSISYFLIKDNYALSTEAYSTRFKIKLSILSKNIFTFIFKMYYIFITQLTLE